MGVKASYYFRIGKGSNQPECIKRIAALGHEIGYHYEDMSLCRGDYDKAYAHFKNALEYFRQFYPVRTCCMHGAPMSKYDSRALWEKYNYRDLQLIGEPYYDVDFNQVLYLTDTGRCWDGYNYSLRDKVPEHQERWNKCGWWFHRTPELIIAMEDRRLPAGDDHHAPATLDEQLVRMGERTDSAEYKNYVPSLGDIMGMTKGKSFDAYGHVCMYCGNGNGWISDFKQKKMNPYNQPVPYRIFRHV